MLQGVIKKADCHAYHQWPQQGLWYCGGSEGVSTSFTNVRMHRLNQEFKYVFLFLSLSTFLIIMQING